MEINQDTLAKASKAVDAVEQVAGVVTPVVEAAKASEKPWYKSEIIWAQVVGAALELINLAQPIVPSGSVALGVQALTIALRLTSNTVLKYD